MESETTRLKINDAVAINTNDLEESQEVELGRIIAFTMDGRCIAESQAAWSRDKFVEKVAGQFPACGRYEKTFTKGWFGATEEVWKFIPNE